MQVISCNAAYNIGGMGKNLAILVEQARAAGDLSCYYANAAKPNDIAGCEVSLERWRWLFRSRLLRCRHHWRDFLAGDLFDRAVAGQLRQLQPDSIFTGFGGRAYHSFVRARQLQFQKLVLASANPHISHVMRQHQIAFKTYPVEESWLNAAQYKKTLQEYERADVIQVFSEYTRQTFLEAGVAEAKLERGFLTVEPRFAPPARSTHADGFTVVYVGRLQVSKGLPVLIEAFTRVQDNEARLILVGGYGTDGMEDYLRRRLEADKRIEIRPGDPLPILHRADVLVHPSFEDGLGLAPLEALACGVPVIVTEDTGMKEYVMSGHNGYIVPTGDVDALVNQLRHVRQRPLKGKFQPFSLERTVEHTMALNP